MTAMLRLLPLLALLALPARAEAPAWPVDLYDPGAKAFGPADLILPLPCGGAMAFQLVDIPMDAADPLADVRLRLGQSNEAMGFSEYLRQAWLRGGFAAADGQSTHFFIGRYEVTQGQARALGGDCSPPTRKDRLAQGGLSWYDATDLARAYTEWLYVNAAAALPRQDSADAFLRLPDETEWEYATRGGARIDANQFSARRFFGEGVLGDYASYFTGSARGKPGPVGLHHPNPLGLFDVYGNVEEVMLDPFRLNVLGREHGQTGGVVTRGGSSQSTEDQIYSAQRDEYPPFVTETGKPMAPPTFGARLVLSVSVTTSDARVTALRGRWQALAAGAAPGPDGATTTSLDDLITGEVDPSRRHALENLRADMRNAQERVLTALRQSARSTLIAGAIFVGNLRDGHTAITSKAFSIGVMIEMRRVSTGDSSAKTRADTQIENQTKLLAALRRSQKSYLLSYSSTLQTLTTDIPEAEDRAAFAQLRSELDLASEFRLIGLLDEFWRDLAIYRTRPDLDAAGFLDLAMK